MGIKDALLKCLLSTSKESKTSNTSSNEFHYNLHRVEVSKDNDEGVEDFNILL